MLASVSETMEAQCITNWIVIRQYRDTGRAVVISCRKVAILRCFTLSKEVYANYLRTKLKTELVHTEPKYRLQLTRPRQGARGRRGR